VAKELTVKSQTFDSPLAAIKHARKLLDKGEISPTEWAGIEKKMLAADKSGQVKAWLKKNFPDEHLSMDDYARKRKGGWNG
jgi:hypothetical protein